ncbi:hypothetical protein HMPREF1109_0245 [Streptococcus intermedius SK54 = ATCC 27335]|nr:hypothetical protein HMPREF1109_0245 [Streptococcus intermedius SK54 = ATCC 27335]
MVTQLPKNLYHIYTSSYIVYHKKKKNGSEIKQQRKKLRRQDTISLIPYHSSRK